MNDINSTIKARIEYDLLIAIAAVAGPQRVLAAFRQRVQISRDRLIGIAVPDDAISALEAAAREVEEVLLATPQL